MITKQFIIKCIENSRGDDLVRAKIAFRDFSAEEMKQEYGQSGKTRKEVLGDYWLHDKMCNMAIAAVELQIDY